jgi:hypothetical protein
MSSPWKAYLYGIGPAVLIETSIITAAAYKGSGTKENENLHHSQPGLVSCSPLSSVVEKCFFDIPLS